MVKQDWRLEEAATVWPTSTLREITMPSDRRANNGVAEIDARLIQAPPELG